MHGVPGTVQLVPVTGVHVPNACGTWHVFKTHTPETVVFCTHCAVALSPLQTVPQTAVGAGVIGTGVVGAGVGAGVHSELNVPLKCDPNAVAVHAQTGALNVQLQGWLSVALVQNEFSHSFSLPGTELPQKPALTQRSGNVVIGMH